jgi:hypothetical protein
MAEAVVSDTKANPVTVTLNERAVALPDNHVTGLEIKQAAIAQGVPIQVEFVLSEELGERKTRIVGDAETITVSDHSRFLAIPPDDNSFAGRDCCQQFLTQ